MYLWFKLQMNFTLQTPMTFSGQILGEAEISEMGLIWKQRKRRDVREIGE